MSEFRDIPTWRLKWAYEKLFREWTGNVKGGYGALARGNLEAMEKIQQELDSRKAK